VNVSTANCRGCACEWRWQTYLEDCELRAPVRLTLTVLLGESLAKLSRGRSIWKPDRCAHCTPKLPKTFDSRTADGHR
jgi:hypothetical protein